MERQYMSLKGSCLCGKVTFQLNGDFDHFYLCHCSYCRKDTGSAHAANLFTKASALTWLSGENAVKSFNLPSTRHVKSFCSECGSALPNTEMGGDICVVPAGSLDDPVLMSPEAHIFTDSQADWAKDLESVKHFRKFPM